MGTAGHFSLALPGLAADAKHSPPPALPQSHRSHPNPPARAASSSAHQLLPECPTARSKQLPSCPRCRASAGDWGSETRQQLIVRSCSGVSPEESGPCKGVRVRRDPTASHHLSQGCSGAAPLLRHSSLPLAAGLWGRHLLVPPPWAALPAPTVSPHLLSMLDRDVLGIPPHPGPV